MLPSLVRAGRAPLRRLVSTFSSPRALPPRVPYAISGGGCGGNLPPLLLPLYAHPSPSRNGAFGPASGARRGISFCARAVDVGDEAPSSSAAAGSDLSAPYLSVHIRCRRQDAEVLSEALLCFGASSVTVDDIDDVGNLDEISITSIYADGEDVDSSVSSAASSAGLNYSPVYETSVGKQCDWVAAVQETYESTEVADGLWIVPKWRTPPNPQATNIIINPGLAFGTGEHPTTKLCLLLLREVIKGGEHVLDYGTGTGVLGIAALKMGAALATGIDIDPLAITSASENLLLNDLRSNQMPVYLVPTNAQPSSLPNTIDKTEEHKLINNLDLKSSGGTYDVVAANILLNPLLELVEDIVGYAKPGGIVAVSGILEEQVPKVKEVYSTYLDNIAVSEMDGWACLQGTRRV
ncbi:Ribosomal protein L11 methyltransferase [Dichanthelium oligosanthes]|uniref:ETFB lysine methyltransferase n=1 Tax=Dichanthelium oligosanthes TaxID=888268 RepID=A0A1E5UZG7_9POAL|nr:Ribosomal protein L11 methyltransferase [Dichanthelium oligosanthes]